MYCFIKPPKKKKLKYYPLKFFNFYRQNHRAQTVLPENPIMHNTNRYYEKSKSVNRAVQTF